MALGRRREGVGKRPSTDQNGSMKTVIADGYTLNPGDLSWAALEALGELAVYERTAPGELIPRAQEAEALLTNKTVMDAAAIARLPRLRYIGVLATGYNVVDVGAAERRGVVVTNVPAYSTDSVAQHAFALILELCLHVQAHADSVRAGDWSRAKDFSYSRFPLVELAGKCLGIVGLGRIGRAVARIGQAFAMRVVAAASAAPGATGTGGEQPIERLPREELLRTADIVCLTSPLTPETAGLINAATLSRMKRSSLLINVSRGGLVVEADLAAALASRTIAGAGLDVLSGEPPRPENPLLSAPNCIITPHIAWATREARARAIEIAAANLRAFIGGAPENVVHG